MDKKSIVNDLYQAAVISVLAVCYSMLGKKILRMTLSSVQKFDLEDKGKLVAIVAASEMTSVQKFDLEDTGKLVAIVAASEMTREYLIKQKILPDGP